MSSPEIRSKKSQQRLNRHDQDRMSLPTGNKPSSDLQATRRNTIQLGNQPKTRNPSVKKITAPSIPPIIEDEIELEIINGQKSVITTENEKKLKSSSPVSKQPRKVSSLSSASESQVSLNRLSNGYDGTLRRTNSTADVSSLRSTQSAVVREQYCCCARRTRFERILLTTVTVLAIIIVVLVIVVIILATDKKLGKTFRLRLKI